MGPPRLVDIDVDEEGDVSRWDWVVDTGDELIEVEIETDDDSDDDDD